jgi:hypothetical protein
MIDDAIEKIKRENPEFEIYTVSIRTDANASISAINFDSKSNSDIKCRKSNEFNEQQKKYWTAKVILKWQNCANLRSAEIVTLPTFT